jgi:hypothetical protein
MRRVLIVAITVIGLFAPVLASAAVGRQAHFHERVAGAAISAHRVVYTLHDSHFGNGAGVETVKVSGLSGTDTEVTYYGNASTRSKGKFTVGAPDANGIAPITGSGHDISGTGKAKGLKSTYTYRGRYNIKTGAIKTTVKGVYTF